MGTDSRQTYLLFELLELVLLLLPVGLDLLLCFASGVLYSFGAVWRGGQRGDAYGGDGCAHSLASSR